jgi:DNA sulfur modification protein DndB
MTSIFGKTENELSLEKKEFATLKAIKGRQFGKDVYSSVIKFEDLENFLEIFPSVQRDIIPRKVASLRRYIIGGLEKSDDVKMRFFSAVTVSCKGSIYYDEANCRMAIDTYESKLSINDGQHRYEAIRTAIEYLEREFVKAGDKDRIARLRQWIDELKEMVIPVVVFDGLTISEERQLFHDLNNLAQRPSRNANIRLNQTDLYSRMARELSEENKYLTHYGVEMDKQSVHESNPNTILLSTVYASMREILGAEYKYDKDFLNERNYEHYKSVVNVTFENMFYALPHDININGKYLFDKSFTMKAICRFICHARNHLDLQLNEQEIFDVIHSIDWTYNLKQWSMYSGVRGSNGNIVFGGGTSGGFKAVYSILVDKATMMQKKSRRGNVRDDVEVRVSGDN